MDLDVLGRRIVLGAIAAVVCVALLGGIYFWYVLSSSNNSLDANQNSVAPAPVPVTYSTSTLEASQQALQHSAASSASTTASPAVLQASQAALEKAVQKKRCRKQHVTRGLCFVWLICRAASRA
jgi:hypothetical protein